MWSASGDYFKSHLIFLGAYFFHMHYCLRIGSACELRHFSVLYVHKAGNAFSLQEIGLPLKVFYSMWKWKLYEFWIGTYRQEYL